MKPTVGRMLWFWPRNGKVPHSDTTQPLSAQVVAVHDGREGGFTYVNLVVFDQMGHSYPMPTIRLVQPGEDRPLGVSFAEWMPAQQRIAAEADSTQVRLELLEAQVKRLLSAGLPPGGNAAAGASPEFSPNTKVSVEEFTAMVKSNGGEIVESTVPPAAPLASKFKGA